MLVGYQLRFQDEKYLFVSCSLLDQLWCLLRILFQICRPLRRPSGRPFQNPPYQLHYLRTPRQGVSHGRGSEDLLIPGVIIIRGKESSETICKAIQQKFLFCQMSTRSRRFSKLRIYSLSHVSFNQSTPQSNSTAQDTFPHNKDLYSNEVAHIKSSHKQIGIATSKR